MMKKVNKRLASSIILGLLLATPVVSNAYAQVTSGSIYENKTITDSIEVTSDKEIVFDKGKNNEHHETFAVYSQNGKIELTGDEIKINSNGTNEEKDNGTRAVYAAGNGEIVLGNGNSVINVVAKDPENEGAMGITAISSGSKISVNAKELNVNTPDSWFGIHVQNNTETEYAPENAARIDIKADKITVNSKYLGLSAFSNGQMNIEGDLVVNAQNAIDVRGNSTVNINIDSTHTTVLNGDIVFETPNAPGDAQNSGKIINANVNINLNGEGSSWTGRSYQEYRVRDETSGNYEYVDVVEIKEDPYHGNVTGFEMNISNGAQWNMTDDSFINNVDLNDGGVINVQENVEKFNAAEVDLAGGIVNVQGTNAVVSISEAVGEGTVNMNTVTADGENFETGTMRFGKANAKMNINFTGITADNVKDSNEALTKLAQKIEVADTDNSKLTGSLNIEEGILNGAVSGGVNTENGDITVQDVQQNQSTSTMDNMRDVASVALVAWRQEDSTLSQRLGELRNSEGDQGIWTRMSRGEFEYGGAFKNQYNYFQIGYDKAYGDWHYGAAISHNDGKTTYAAGNGENRSTSLSLYGTWLGEKGNYVDVVLKQGRLSNEFTNYAEAGKTTGDYDAWGTSLSAEYGQKVELESDWYVTPQAQLTYMRIGSEDYTANVDGKAMQVSQDTLQSFVGRVGFELGKNVSDKGSVYVKASLLHEFAGDADTYLRMGDLSNSYKQDLSDTWYECGLGVNYKTSANSYVYADVVKTFGGDVETPWQWNAGMRWSF